MAIFSDMVEEVMDVFLVFGTSFAHCLHNLNIVLERCQAKNLVLNWEKCHFMVHEGIVLGHRVSKEGLEVYKAKILAIENLVPPMNVKGVRSFLAMRVSTDGLLEIFLKLQDLYADCLRKMHCLCLMMLALRLLLI